MVKLELSTKRLQISKANATMVGMIAIASFVTMFCLVASRALLSQRAYQARVIAAKEKARDQLKANIAAVDTLTTSYKSFVGTSENVIGGNPSGTGERDGDNARIILDALPSKYDFPALTTSVEKLLSTSSIKIDSITGTDDEKNQQDKTSPDPTVQEMPFTLAATGDYTKLQNIVLLMEKSIRPFQMDAVTLSGNQSSLQLNVSAKSYYQPEKSLSITTKEIK